MTGQAGTCGATDSADSTVADDTHESTGHSGVPSDLRMRLLLCDEFKVAAQIYECNLNKQPLWFGKLAELLKPYMTDEQAMKGLRVLFDWGIVKAEYGETTKGKAGRLLYISSESRFTVKDVYDNYWKQ